MVKVYAKHLVKAALASLLLSLGAHASDLFQQQKAEQVECNGNDLMERFVTVGAPVGQCQASSAPKLKQIEVNCKPGSCVQTDNLVAYYKVGNTVVEKIKLEQVEWGMRKTVEDCDASKIVFCPEKREGQESDSCQQSALQVKACKVGPSATQLTSATLADDFHGTITGEAGIVQFTRSRLELPDAFASDWERLPVEKITEEEFLQEFHGDLKSLGYGRDEIRAIGLDLLAKLNKNQVLFVGQAASQAKACSSSQSSEIGKGKLPVQNGKRDKRF